MPQISVVGGQLSIANKEVTFNPSSFLMVDFACRIFPNNSKCEHVNVNLLQKLFRYIPDFLQI